VTLKRLFIGVSTDYLIVEARSIALSGKTLHVKVLTSEADKTRGYQFQKKTPGFNQGLLFVFNQPDIQSFHMRNVWFDLEALAFDERGFFIGYVPMKATAGVDPDTKVSLKAYHTPPNTMYVIECQPGWGTTLKRGITRLKF